MRKSFAITLLIIATVIGAAFLFLNHAIGWKPWPESPEKKQTILKHCAEALRSAVDTNQFTMVVGKLSALPAILKSGHQSGPNAPVVYAYATNTDVRLAFADLAQKTTARLEDFASLMTSPNLKTFVGKFRGASISNPHNPNTAFTFFIAGHDYLVHQANEFPQTLTNRRLTSSAVFYENGRLKWYEINEWNGNARLHSTSISFTEDGKFDGCALWTPDGRQVELRTDEAGAFRVRIF